MKTKGFLIVSAIIFAAIMASVSLVLSKSLMLALATQTQRCAFYQSQFLAQSGFVYAKKHWNEIPISTFTITKEALYANQKTGLPVLGLDGSLSLIKTATMIYSIASCPSKSRAIFYASFTKTGDKVILGPVQKL